MNYFQGGIRTHDLPLETGRYYPVELLGHKDNFIIIQFQYFVNNAFTRILIIDFYLDNLLLICLNIFQLI